MNRIKNICIVVLILGTSLLMMSCGDVSTRSDENEINDSKQKNVKEQVVETPDDKNLDQTYEEDKGLDDTVQSNVTKQGQEDKTFRNINVGDYIEFGNYVQEFKEEEEPVSWRVLAVESGKALIISEKVLFAYPYHKSKKDITWEDSSLRAYLNDTFYKTVFSVDEQMKILETNIVNDDNNTDRTLGGNDTVDKIFCLSLKEASKYFQSDEDRVAFSIDDYAYYDPNQSNERTHTVGGMLGEGDDYWLRSPGMEQCYAAVVSKRGDLQMPVGLGSYRTGVPVNNDTTGVRPALWVEVEKENIENISDASSDGSFRTGNVARKESVSVYKWLVDNLSEESAFCVFVKQTDDESVAMELWEQLSEQGFPAHVLEINGTYFVTAGAYSDQGHADDVMYVAKDWGYPDAWVQYSGYWNVNAMISVVQ